jgi:hypothetical protein
MKQTLVLSPPGNNFYSTTLFIVLVTSCKYPVSIAGLLTSITNTYVGGIGGLFIYSLLAMKSTDPLLSSALSS